MSTSSSIPGSPAMSSSKIEPRPEEIIVDATNPNIMEDLRHQVFQGQLYKFTNVVKGWQYRWFELHPETGHLEYYYYEDQGLHELVSGKEKTRKVGNKGKKEHIAGAVVVPSEEDSQTFNVNFASGESYKLRAPNVRERQIWVDRLRAVSQLHDRAIAHSNPPVGKNVLLHHQDTFHEPPPGSKTHLNKHGEPSDALQNLSLSVLDAFGSVHDILYQCNLKHQKLTEDINSLPMQTPDQKSKRMEGERVGPFCHDDDLLLLKATSHSALACMENALALLQDIRQAQRTSQFPNKYEDHNLKGISYNAKNGVKGSKISEILSPLNMSPSRKISSGSTSSTFLTQDLKEQASSRNSSTLVDDFLGNKKNARASKDSRSHLDTLSIKSAVIPSIEEPLKKSSGVDDHGMMSSLSRSTPSVNVDNNIEDEIVGKSDEKPNTPKKEAHGQTS